MKYKIRKVEIKLLVFINDMLFSLETQVKENFKYYYSQFWVNYILCVCVYMHMEARCHCQDIGWLPQSLLI